MQRSISSLFLLILIAISAYAAAPQAASFPEYSGYLTDSANMIEPDYAKKINYLANKVNENTGVEMAVATVRSTYPLDSKTYAVQLFERWGVGKKGKDNGLLILLVKRDRRVEIEVGYGLEGTITDAFSGEVLDKVAIPQFKKEAYGKGTYLALLTLSDKISREYAGRPGTKIEQINLNLYSVVLAISVIITVFILSLLGRSVAGTIMSGVVGAVIGYLIAGVVGVIFGFIIGLAMSAGGYYGGGFGGGWGGGFGGGGGSGGFGGFGGGRSGGGGAGRGF